MTKKNFATTLLCLLLSICFVTVSYADTPIIYQPQQATQAAYVKSYADIPSGRTADGFYYGLERMVKLREIIHGEPVTITSATKLANNQYQVTCVSNNPFSNGTFIVDIYPSSDNELKEGYQLWFSLFDGELKKRGTAHVKKVK